MELQPPALARDPAAGRRLALLALLLLVPAPTIGTAAAMILPQTEGTTLGKAMYGLSKLWIMVLPAAWLLLVERGRLSLSPARRGGLATGIGLGIVISAVIFAVYALAGERILPAATIREEAIRNGIGTVPRYLAFVAFLSLFNSLVEEYVWRWFVFRKCEVLLGGPAAVGASALFFTVHHVIALKAQMPWSATLLASAGVFIGGAVWSWCYLRFRSIWPGYVSHLVVDAAIFTIGWKMIFG